MKRQWNKLLSFLLAAAVLLCALPPLTFAESGTVTIRTAEDLAALSENCALDSWSRGKTIVLAADVDLAGADFSPIPTFGGVFDGGGHTISGLSITGSGDAQGLFRTVQAGGVVRDLRVEGAVAPDGDSVGGVAGVNAGLIQRCSFAGRVEGGTNAGGVAGCNEAGGELAACSFSGSVSGELHTGGIVGQNLGSAVECVNRGSVNTVQLEDEADAQTILSESSVEDAAADLSGWTDVGGVAGYSSGILQSCRNEGDVGYPHIGYNIGGIAGRQSGLLGGCVNTGAVQGRKDVGGVVGQLEPQVTLLYSETFLNRLGGELSVLQQRMDALLRDADGVSSDVSAQLDAIAGQTDSVREAADALSHSAANWADEGAGQLSDLSARVSRALETIEPALDAADGQLALLSEAASHLSGAFAEAKRLGRLNEEELGEAAAALESLQKNIEAARSALSGIRAAGKRLRESLGDLSAMTAAAQELLTQCEALETALAAVPDSIAALQKAIGALEGTDEAEDFLTAFRDASKDLSLALDSLSESAKLLREAADALTDGPALRLPALSGTVTAQADALSGALSDLTQAASDLNAIASASSGVLLGDLQAVNKQIGVIAALLQDESARTGDGEDLIEDVSGEEGGSAPAGRVFDSRNEGAVNGDVDAGGIAGAMAVDLEFDPEDDLAEEGDRSVTFLIQTMAAVTGCRNTGAVTAKKDCAGGVVGRMDLGLLDSCVSYGDVTSTSGGYVGGVAGDAAGPIRSCWSRCTVTGRRSVGGVAGRAASLTDCRSASRAEGESLTGSVAGELAADGTASGCLYAEDMGAAIDGVSYEGQAEPVAFETLCGLSGAPEDFEELTLLFTAGEEIVEKRTVTYGSAAGELPEIPAREGCTAAWPKLDYSRVTASHAIEAVYTPYLSAISDGTEPAQVLAEGCFGSGASLKAVSEAVSWTADGRTVSGLAWTVTVEDEELGVSAYTVHFRLPEEGDGWELWVRTGDGWERKDFRADGRYLLFEADGAETVFCVTQRSFPVWQAAAGIGAGAAAAAVVLVFLLRRKKRKAAD